jgi:glycosyltransferase involved in cell wall biosynthesis
MKASVIIPTCNRFNQLFRTIKSVLEVDFDPIDFEVIVVDNGSTDTTMDVVAKYISENPKFKIKYIFDDVPGLLTGRHRGAKEAASDILVFIDDDVQVQRNWLASIVKTFEKFPDVHLVGGKCLPLFEKEPPKWLKYFWKEIPNQGKMLVELSLCDFGDIEKEVNPGWIWGLNFSIRKKTMYDLGGFHPDSIPASYQKFQGDGETGLTDKLFRMGLKAVYNPNALVYHEVPAERMTQNYFDKRNFYQGVCNSYTDIRRRKGMNYSIINQIFARFVKGPAGKLLRAFSVSSGQQDESDLSVEEKEERKILFQRAVTMQQKGYDFHREAALSSPKVLNWILKENYFDYKLPE